MSDNFNNKGYEDYFKVLEQQMNKAPQKRAAEPAPKKVIKQKPAVKSHGIYKTVRIRKSAIAACLAAVIVIVGAVAVLSGSNKPQSTASEGSQSQETADSKENGVLAISYTFNSQTVAIPGSNDAQCAIIIDKSNNTVVASREPHKRAYPASTTKIMTLLVAAENITDLDDTFTMTLEITDPLFVAEASVAGFLDGEEVTMTDLLYGMILPSGADGAMGLAVKIAGSEEEFVKLMNKKVEELGLENTHFANVSGLHSTENYSSAYDMAVILDAAMQNELCREVLSTYQYTTRSTEQNPEGLQLSSTLFSYMYGTEPETATILGGKTGFVNESGYCIASFGKSNESEKEYIVVTLGNSARWPAFYGQIDLYKQFAK